jgi:Na+/H+ antiporter NhaC
MSIISFFFFMVPSFTKHSYNENESVQTIIEILKNSSRYIIILKIVPIATAIFISLAIP